MKTSYSKLLETAYIGKMRLRNRMVMSPMGTHNYEPDGRVSKAMAKYYETRAAGGAGMIITEGLFISKIDPWVFQHTTIDTETQMLSWKKLADAIKAHGARACIQMMSSLGKNGFPAPGNDSPPVSASEIPTHLDPKKNTRALKVEEIKELVNTFARAGERAVFAGFDAVEVHAHVGYLLDQFMWTFWNKRTDEYGGSFENRMRLPVEIIHALRKVVGPNIPILFRLSVDHLFEGGRTLEETFPVLRYLEAAGVDAFDLDCGSYESKQYGCPPIYYGDAVWAEQMAACKKVVKVPILSSGNYTPEAGEEALELGKADFIMIGRGLIADPDLPNKLREGRREDIRPCLRCNDYCLGSVMKGLTATCGINAVAGAEADYPITRTEKPKKVVVIGGGPGGMEAARIAALKGHDVSLYEKHGQLGGLIKATATGSFKRPLRDFIAYQETQLKKLHVKVQFYKTITADSPELQVADQIVIASGSVPVVPPIKGIDGDNVVGIVDAHLGRKKIGDKVVVVGGGLSGCDYALELAMEGKKVTIVEMLDKLAPITNLPASRLAAYEKLDTYNRIALLQKLAEYGVEVLTNHKVLEFTKTGVQVKDDKGKIHDLKADTVVYSLGMKSSSEIVDKVCEKYPTARPIGDCTKVAQIGETVREGFFAGWSIQ